MLVKATFIIFSVVNEESIQWKQQSRHDSTDTHTQDKHQGISVPAQQGKSAYHENIS